MRALLCALGLGLVLCGSVGASAKVGEDGLEEPTVYGQLRPRLEYRDPVAGGDDSFTSMRTRLGATAGLARGVQVKVEFQDVRLWGEETSTLADFSADRLDLHQGYVDFGDFAGSGVDMRLGRQEISLGGQRLVGAVGWTQQGRAFDGVRLRAPLAGAKVDVIGLRLADSSAPGIAANAYLAGVYTNWAALGNTELFLLYNSVGAATDQLTVGFRLPGRSAGLDYRVEAAYQSGQRGGQDVAAFMAAVRAGMHFKRVDVALWFDYLSGDDDPGDGETRVFDTLFATNHKFYGYADYFLNIPLHTAGLGLRDLALKGAYKPCKEIKLGLDLHSFFHG